MASPDGKRRLPLAPRVEVKEPEDEDRPPWHWSAIGAVGSFVLWLPLAIVVNAGLGARGGAIGATLNAAAFAIACFGAGLVVGRFGGKAGRKEAAIGGASVAAIAWALAAKQSMPLSLGAIVTWLLLLVAIGALGGGAAWLGGALGVRRRSAKSL
jgi:MFS family permease